MDGFPSGQREQTVNLPPQTSVVRIPSGAPTRPAVRGRPMVGVVQWLERQVVALEIVGSSPITHPICRPLPQSDLASPVALGRSQAAKARDFDSRIRRFDPCRPSQYDPLAQSVEHLTFNQRVPRSSRGWVTIFLQLRAGVAEWQTRQI